MPYKAAIIGFGGMANGHYDMITEHVKGLTVKGAYDIRPEAREAITAKGIISYESADVIYNDPDIDLAVIATPNDTHKPYAVACLKAGKHVVCEKPAALDYDELADIYKTADTYGKFFTVHQNRRWDADFRTVKKILDDKLLIDPFRIESRVQASVRYLHGWRGYKINGGGMILDWGAHLVDQMLLLCEGSVVSVDCHAHGVFAKEVEDNFTALFKFDSGLSYLIEITNHNLIPPVRWNICCADGTALIENPGCTGRIVKIAGNGEPEIKESITYAAEGPVRTDRPMPFTQTKEYKLPKVKPYNHEYYKNIVASLGGKEQPIVTSEQALRVMEVIGAMFESAKKGRGLACDI